MLFLLLVAVIVLGIYVFRRDHPVQKDAVNIALWRMIWGILVVLVIAGMVMNAVR
nr:hypothetical protein [Rhodococcus sp. 06-418-1B]